MTGTTFSPRVRTLIYERALYLCEVCGTYAYGGSVHHRRPRGMGGSKLPALHAASNGVLLCGSGTTGCHGEIESSRAGAYVDGLLLRHHQDPATTPVQLRYGLVLLDDEGGWTPTTGSSIDGSTHPCSSVAGAAAESENR